MERSCFHFTTITVRIKIKFYLPVKQGSLKVVYNKIFKSHCRLKPGKQGKVLREV